MRAASSGFESSRQCVGADPGKRTREIFKLAWSAGDEIEENQDRATLANKACAPPGSAWRSRLIPVALHQPDRAGIVIGPHRLEAIAPGGAGQRVGDLPSQALAPLWHPLRRVDEKGARLEAFRPISRDDAVDEAVLLCSTRRAPNTY
jgi:hypothetical protein